MSASDLRRAIPRIPDHGNSRFAMLKQRNLFLKGTPSAEFHSSIARPGELVVYKHRVGAFSENELHMILRAKGIENPVFFGISTSGITLSRSDAPPISIFSA